MVERLGGACGVSCVMGEAMIKGPKETGRPATASATSLRSGPSGREAEAGRRPSNSGKPKSEYSIQTVSNALRMLEVFHSVDAIGVSDLGRHLGLHKNNTFRLLATLELAGYMQKSEESDLYHLGPRCLELGEAYSRAHPLMRQARPILEELAENFGETAHLAQLSDDQVLHIDGVLPDQLLLTGLRVGQRSPLHCTALGKVLIAPRVEESRALLESVEAMTPATIVDPAKLGEELRSVELRGYAVDCEEYAAGLCCVAAPVRDANSKVVAALSLSGPSNRLSESVLHGAAATTIRAAAEQLSQALAAPPSEVS